jgi:hypothetical protein
MSRIKVVVNPETFDPELAVVDGFDVVHDIAVLGSDKKEEKLNTISEVLINLEKIKKYNLDLYDETIELLINKGINS